MDKINLIYEYTKDAYDLALKRREGIRNRTNIVAAFGFSIMSILLASTLDVLAKETIELSCIMKLYVTLAAVSFILFVIFYLLVYGVKTITDVDPLEAIYKISDIHEINNENKEIYTSRCSYYGESGYEKPHIIAENYVTMHYISTLYANQTNNIYKNSKKMNSFFNLMAVSMIVTIFLLILMRGGF